MLKAALTYWQATMLSSTSAKPVPILRKIKVYKYYFENVSMIPYVLKFEVIDSISKRRIGTLDQQFVGDYGEKGNVFVLKGSQWRILSVDEVRLVVNVEPLRG